MKKTPILHRLEALRYDQPPPDRSTRSAFSVYMDGPEVQIEARIAQIHLKGGAAIAAPPGGIVVVVGPNNVGKSLTVNESFQRLIHPPTAMQYVVVDGIDMIKSGSDEDVKSWLRGSGMTVGEGGGETARRHGSTVEMWRVSDGWRLGPPFGNLGYLFASLLNAGNGASWIQSTQSFDAGASLPSNPLQHLYLRPDLEKQLSDVCREAFGFGLVVDRFAGSVIRLRVGDAPQAQFQDGIPTTEYLDALRALTLLEREGAGVQNFMGIILFLLSSPALLTFIDEPDAFLHPPQAELMGRMLAKYKHPSGQLLIATHNSHLLRGLLSDSSATITVVRLLRKDGRTTTAQLHAERVNELWSDPLLRYSHLFEGLFHTGVVVCEGDADCRFYESVLDDLHEPSERHIELLFSHAGGKDRIPRMVRAIRAASVPVGVIVDFDILRDSRKLMELIGELGGDWATVERDWRIVKGAVDGLPTARLSRQAVQEELRRYLDAVEGPFLEQKDVQYVRSLTQRPGGWEQAKRSGLEAVPAGSAYEAIVRLTAELRTIGLFVVDVGQLEGFVRNVGGHGPAWVTAVHEQQLHRGNEEARRMLGQVEAYFRPYQS